MLTAAGCQTRRQRLWQAVLAENSQAEWLLIADPRHVQYLCGFWVNPFSFSSGERGLLLLELDGKSTLLADNFTVRSAVATPFVDEVVAEKWYDHKHSVINRDHALFDGLRSVAGKLKGRMGAVEGEWLPFDALNVVRDAGATLVELADVPLGSLLRALRRRKDPDEIDLLRKAIHATAAGQARCREVIKAGMTEWDLFREVQSAVLADLGFPAMIYGDFRATSPEVPKAGGLPTHYVLKAGDLFIVDYSTVICGYRSDFTNTFCVGTPSAAQQKLMETCLAGMHAGEKTLRAGTPAKEVFEATAGPLRAAGYDLAHHAGHGIGLAHPEAPILVPESTDTLLSGDVITLEPGLYIPGIGGMWIEHNYLVTETGYERLSNHQIGL